MPENTLVPLYQQIKEDIKSAIERGKYKLFPERFLKRRKLFEYKLVQKRVRFRSHANSDFVAMRREYCRNEICHRLANTSSRLHNKVA